jgi:hypothetical protein
MAVVSLLQASIGFGSALLVVPLLVLSNPAFVPGPHPEEISCLWFQADRPRLQARAFLCSSPNPLSIAGSHP